MAVKKSLNSEIWWSKATVIYIFRSLYQTDSCSFNFIGPWKKGTEIFSFFSFSQKNNIVLIMTVTIKPFLYFDHLCNNTVKTTVRECYSAQGWLWCTEWHFGIILVWNIKYLESFLSQAKYIFCLQKEVVS